MANIDFYVSELYDQYRKAVICEEPLSIKEFEETEFKDRYLDKVVMYLNGRLPKPVYEAVIPKIAWRN